MKASFPCFGVLQTFRTAFAQGQCVICGKELSENSVCRLCDDDLKRSVRKQICFVPKNDKSAICAAAFSYKPDVVKSLLFYMKQHYDWNTVKYAAVWLRFAFMHLPENAGQTLVVTVPRSRSGKWKYGFDQGECLGKAFAKMTPNAVFKPLIVRRGFGRPQKELTASERSEASEKEYAVSVWHLWYLKCFFGKPDRIVIVDDVITTGSSFYACRKLLMQEYPHLPVQGVFIAMT